MMKQRILILGIALLSVLTARGQNVQDQASIQVLGSAGEETIRLRWAPTDHLAWLRLNEYGYDIVRITLARNGQVLANPETRTLTDEGGITPNPLADWEGLIDNNDYAAVAAQALYGETFELTENYDADIMQIVQKTQELEQRFSFALFAADQDFMVAQMAGLGFIDHSARKGEKYLYRIIPRVPAQVEPIQLGTVFLGLEDYAPLPRPVDVQTLFGDGAVMVSWERASYDGIFNSYYLERSDDGGTTFQPTTAKPAINTFEGEQFNTRRFYKLDSLPQNGKEFYYRVRGVTPFGELSPPSDTVSGAGFIPLTTPPNFTRWTTDEKVVDLGWDFPTKDAQPIDGFLIERSRAEGGPYQTLAELGAQNRDYQDQRPLATNYYRVTAFRADARRSSFPVLVQLADSIPPAMPRGLAGQIDTAGIVSLTWSANQEPDLLGYRVYRSNFASSEFAQITREPVNLQAWLDTVNVKTLTESLYYQITAVDFRYNESEPSEMLSLARPDVVPPVPPVFKNVLSGERGVELSFTASSSKDVVHYLVFRRAPGEPGWSQLAQLPLTQVGSYTDASATPNQKYAYTVVAVDDQGLESEPATPVVGSYARTMTETAPSNLRVRINRDQKQVTLTWEFAEGASEYRIYRKQGDQPLTLYRTIPGEILRFDDANLELNTQYTYGVQAVLDQGIKSTITLKSIVF